MEQVFEQSSIAGMVLKNRIIRSATYEGLGDENGFPQEKLTNLYVRLARGGVGAIITGFLGVKNNGKYTSRMCMIDDDKYIEAYRKMNQAIKPYGVPIIAQIAHCGGQANSSITGEEVVAPSALKCSLSPDTARALTSGEIEEIIDSFINSVERAKKAGFDGAQLHAAHGYLLSEFLSPATNQRTDQWGGSSEGRFRIISEILLGSRERVGSYPIWMKLSAYDGDKNGMRIDEAVKVAQMFAIAGGDAIEVSCGGVKDGAYAVRFSRTPSEAIVHFIPGFKDKSAISKKMARIIMPFVFKSPRPIHNYNLEAAQAIRKQVNIPVIVVGGFRHLDDIEKAIVDGKADYVSLSRPFIIEPTLVNKFQAGKQRSSRCIDCGYCIIGVGANPLRCYQGKIK